MKKGLTFILILSAYSSFVFSQGTWTQKANFGGTQRDGTIGFSIGTKGYIGTGRNSVSAAEYVDFWEFDPSTNSWSQKADFGGGARHDAVGFSINNKGYVGTGVNVNGPVFFNDFWEYDPFSNVWSQKANFGGSGRYGACGFSIGSSGYIGTGYDGTWKKDFWKYNTVTDTWIQKSDYGGIPRYEAASFSIDGNGYLGTGENNITPLNDFWKYDTTGNSWTQVANFAGGARWSTISFSVLGNGFVGTGVNGSTAFIDIWIYSPASDTWSQVSSLGGGARHDAVGFSINNKGYSGTGNGPSGNKNDFWEFNYNAGCTPDITTGLVANYLFSGNTNDASGNNNNGTAVGASMSPDRFGNANSAYSLNGTSDYISLPSGNTTSLNIISDYTISFWIKTTDDSGLLTSLGDNVSGPPNAEGYLTGLNGGNVGNGKMGAATRGIWYSSISNTLADNNWHHIVAVLKTDTLQFYIDNILENQVTGIASPLSWNGNRVLGCRHDLFMTAAANYGGLLDDVFIFNRALNICDIDSLYYNLNPTTGVYVPSCDTLYYSTTNISWFGQTVKSTDGNIVTVGTENHIYNWSNGDIFLNKYDTAFNLIWSRKFYVGGGMDVASGVLATSDGGYIIHSSFGNSNPAGNFSAGYIIKTDSSGNQQWVQTLTGQSYGDNYGAQVVENSSGEFICYGYVQHHAGCSSYSTRITKLSSSGSIVWSNCIQLNPDKSGGITKLAASDIYISAFNNASNGTIELRKWDDTGNQIGLNTYQFNNQQFSVGAVKSCQTGGYFVYGQYNSTGNQKNAFLAKFDDSMNFLWEASDSTNDENLFSTMTENTQGNIFCASRINNLSQQGDLAVTHYNSSGVYQSKGIFNGPSTDDYIQGIVTLPNGDIICSGRSDSQGILVKFCGLGNTSTSVSEISTPVDQLTLFPNPTTDFINFTYYANDLLPYRVSIFNMAGQQIFNKTYNPTSPGKQKQILSLHDFQDGIYLIRLESGDARVTKKLIVAR
jgi:hypothetical protein